MSNSILAVSAAAVILAVPAPALSRTIVYAAKSPIAVTSFRVNESYAPGTVGTDLEQAPQLVANDVSLKFVNNGNVPATTVTFSVTDGRFMQVIVDKGTFSPGVSIKHNFPIADGADTLSNATCNVTEVDFADGSVWRADQGVPALKA